MRIAFISAGLGNLENYIQDRHLDQTIGIDLYYYDSINMPPRKSIDFRLQAKIPRMFGWELVPDYDYYIWMDACISMSNPNTVQWLLDQLGDRDIAMMKHPEGRNSILDELEHMESHMAGKEVFNSGKEYLNERYVTEPMRMQVTTYLMDHTFIDNKLFATGVFIYRNNEHTRNLLKEWFFHNARYTIQDQLSFPYVLSKSGCSISVIDENIFANDYTYRWRNVI